MAPRAFISHASEDKDRFVLEFARLLREMGIDAWLDKWEMQAGDSLVDRIFEEGIKNADAFVIVLSANSVNKPWVREELNAGFVKRIDGKCRIIPVVIDECEIPECLKSTLWEQFKSLTDIRDQTQRVANAVRGQLDKPPVGLPPQYANTAIDVYPELLPQDHIVLTTACGLTMDSGWSNIDLEKLWPLLIEQGLTDEMIRESIQILAKRNYVSATWALGGGLAMLDVLPSAFESFLRAKMPEYSQIVDAICLHILNENSRSNFEIQTDTQQNLRVINHVLEVLNSRDLIDTATTMGGCVHVTSVNPELTRLYRNK